MGLGRVEHYEAPVHQRVYDLRKPRRDYISMIIKVVGRKHFLGGGFNLKNCLTFCDIKLGGPHSLFGN